jgi:uncharacterized protein YndB with AHSA1/START domain
MGFANWLVCLAPALALAGPAQAEIKDRSPGGFTLENVRTVPVSADEAFRVLVEEVDQWWPRDHTWWGAASTLSIEPRAGGCFCERAGTREAQHMTVGFVDPGRTLRLLGGLGPMQGMGLHGVLEFRFAPDPAGGTRIMMFYRSGGYSPDDLGEFAPIVDRVQALQLGGLAERLGGETPKAGAS